MQKAGCPSEKAKAENRFPAGKKEYAAGKLPDPVRSFLDRTELRTEQGRFFSEGDRIYFLYDSVPRSDVLRYLRTGLLLGTLKNGRFEPSQALAMTLGKAFYAETLMLEGTDPLVEKYLRGESFPDFRCEGAGSGWVLVCADGFPLGWMKASGKILKNKYEPSWRKQ